MQLLGLRTAVVYAPAVGLGRTQAPNEFLTFQIISSPIWSTVVWNSAVIMLQYMNHYVRPSFNSYSLASLW